MSTRITFSDDEIDWLGVVISNILIDEILDGEDSMLTWRQKHHLLNKVTRAANLPTLSMKEVINHHKIQVIREKERENNPNSYNNLRVQR